MPARGRRLSYAYEGSTRRGAARRRRRQSASMNDLSAFPITRKWPPRHPDRLQLYSLPTPNGVKVSIMLEETGLPTSRTGSASTRNDQMSPEFLSLNPNNKIPAILDPERPGRQAAGAVRVGRDPDLPGRQDRPAACPPTPAGALRDASSG